MTVRHQTLADWGELKFLRWVRCASEGTFSQEKSPLVLSIGDDAAHFSFARGLKDLLVTTDALVEGVHFKHEWITPRDLGAKSLAVNLSDIAAMGAKPIAAFLSLGVPAQTQISALKQFFGGLMQLGRRWNCPLAGGDLVRAPHWTINIAAFGQPSVNRRVIRRCDVVAGQLIYVTGWPGESGAGLYALERGDAEPKLIMRHNRPTPRIDEARVLVEVCRDLAMIDVSDGIANDAGHLARESGVRFEIAVNQLPVSPALFRYSRVVGSPALDWILDGGEDYELLFTTNTKVDRIQDAFDREGLTTRVSYIGRVIEGPAGVEFVDTKGKTLRRTPKTFQHFR